ncbi:RNA polymerase sigma factor [Marinicellulosiphila megalodicopiae]|uniref:RNA polymerase sigma factor n=1 Tax=Marinicellulosiphila megalodicopiae TaxID=2724896 RepID=UPI003BB01815
MSELEVTQTLSYPEDRETVRLALASQAGFRKLVEQYYPIMIIVARSIVGENLAEDAVQDSWISIHRNLPKFEFRSSLKTWVSTIAANAAKAKIKKESKYETQENNDFMDRFDDKGHWQSPPSKWEQDSPEALLGHDQLKKCIEKFIGYLKPTHRAVLSLKEMQNLDNSEICNILDISESNVRVLLHRARVEVFSHIEHYQETGEC